MGSESVSKWNGSATLLLNIKILLQITFKYRQNALDHITNDYHTFKYRLIRIQNRIFPRVRLILENVDKKMRSRPDPEHCIPTPDPGCEVLGIWTRIVIFKYLDPDFVIYPATIWIRNPQSRFGSTTLLKSKFVLFLINFKRLSPSKVRIKKLRCLFENIISGLWSQFATLVSAMPDGGIHRQITQNWRNSVTTWWKLKFGGILLSVWRPALNFIWHRCSLRA